MGSSLARPQLCLALAVALTVALPRQGAAADAELIEKELIVEAQKRAAGWKAAKVGEQLAIKDKLRTGEFSRAAVRLTDTSVLRIDELTTIEISAPKGGAGKAALEVGEGGAYFFSREKPEALEIRTPAANGALRGTEFAVRVKGARTTLTMFDGEVELSNPQGRVLLQSGEQGKAEIGRAPRKTAVIDAVNIIEWCLYYPGVLDPADLRFSAAEQRQLERSLAAYRAGDLLGALAAHPKSGGGSADARVYRAMVVLGVGQVEKARAALRGVPPTHAGRVALEQMIAAVKLQDFPRAKSPQSASEWIAESYYEQSRSRLENARAAARKAPEVSPSFGYGWTRLAEMEFSFGRTREALHALERGLHLAPRNAQAHSVRGFLLSAQNRIPPARASFEEAIRLDGALGNAWLGRGLTYIRQGQDELGRRDLQTAAVLEPNRSILRSYLGKAFSQVSLNAQAHQELDRATELDPKDPTPWLYSAIQRKQENRYNAAVRDLETSLTLNENRRVYRSQFLLDQDRGVRSTNLAAIYQNAGMTEVSVREAVRAVNSDYASAGAHLFLANSYNALRDPRRIVLRYETAWFNELLLANLLSPVGGGPLSQFVSQQEYSKLFEADRLGLSSTTDYFSTGELRQTASQFGVSGNLSYALDAEYQHDNGQRPNSDLRRFESYATFKLQLGPQDTVFLQSKYQDLENGDVLQRYDARGAAQSRAEQTFRFREMQEPGLLLLGYHREWNPGVHTLLLLGRLGNDQELSTRGFRQTIVTRDISQAGVSPSADVRRFIGRGVVQRFDGLDFDLDYRARFEAYSAELNQIMQAGRHTFVAGARFQQGEFDTRVRLESEAAAALGDLFDSPPADQNSSVGLQRFSFYAYDFWRVARWLTFVAGAAYDQIEYPENFRSAPINDRQVRADKLSPKLGLVLTPLPGMTIRAAYTESLGGASFDESIRLEPTQIAGFNQAYRTVISESVVGSVAAPRYRSYGISIEQKLPSLTYLGLEISRLEQRVDRTLGAFDFVTADRAAVLPSSLNQQLEYREDVLLATANQLLGKHWSFGARYRFTKAELRQTLPGIARQISARADDTDEAVLHEVGLFGLFNHETGFFARAEANWYNQENSGYAPDASAPRDDPRPGDSFWHFNLFGGYRFFRNQCELSCGLLNLSGEDYRLNPLNLYTELPRDRTFVVRAKFNF